MKTQSKIGLLLTGSAALLFAGNAQAGGSQSHCCTVKKSQAKPKVHHHKIRHHTCKLRRTCHHGHHNPKPRVRPVHKPPKVHYQHRPCRTHKPCAFKPLRIKTYPKIHPKKPCNSDWYNKLAELA